MTDWRGRHYVLDVQVYNDNSFVACETNELHLMDTTLLNRACGYCR